MDNEGTVEKERMMEGRGGSASLNNERASCLGTAWRKLRILSEPKKCLQLRHCHLIHGSDS